MAALPAPVSRFLEGRRIAVAGVARDGRLPANAIFRKLRGAGYDVVPINPNAREVEGVPCYPDLRSVPGAVDGLMLAAPPGAGLDLVAQCAEKGVPRVWFHRSFGTGSVSDDAVRRAGELGIEPIVGGCPMMYVAPDVGHRCFRWLLALRGRVPK